jgi:hypothetical protein
MKDRIVTIGKFMDKVLIAFPDGHMYTQEPGSPSIVRMCRLMKATGDAQVVQGPFRPFVGCTFAGKQPAPCAIETIRKEAQAHRDYSYTATAHVVLGYAEMPLKDVPCLPHDMWINRTDGQVAQIAVLLDEFAY